MKKRYLVPQMDIMLFETEEIVTTSGVKPDGFAGKLDEDNPNDNWGDLL